MKRVTGIGGIFFKGHDPEKLYQWYEKHLGIVREAHRQGATFRWCEQSEDDRREGMTVWAVFPEDKKYFQPSRSALMINYRVDDLDALLASLKQEGVEIDHRE